MNILELLAIVFVVNILTFITLDEWNIIKSKDDDYYDE